MDSLPEVNQRLREIEVAIQAAVTGASYSIEGQQVTRQDLPALYGEPNEPDCEPEARECRRLLVTHLDQLAWGAAGVEDDALARV